MQKTRAPLIRVLIVLVAALSPAATLAEIPAQTPPAPGPTAAPSPQNQEARRWFEQARFGMFIHWGVYSVLGDGEWVLNNRKLKDAQYERLPALFNPTGFDAREWVALAQAAGVRYITVTSKHHDGFAMFDSKLTDWDIVDRTPWKKDPLKQLADECHRRGIKLFFYYSELDWHHPDYFPRGKSGNDTGRPETGQWGRYLDFMDGQLTELLTRYGAVGGIWFDGWWDRKDADWRLDRTYALIHKLQPAALVGSNHHQTPKPGEDFQMFERDLPGGHTAEFNQGSVIGKLPLETCDTINGAWGFNVSDDRWKTPKQLVATLARAAALNANYLLNVGPMPSGKIQPEAAERLRAVGAWLKQYGVSIYGTHSGPVSARPWGVTTSKGQTVYLHVLDWEDPTLPVPALGGSVRSARALKDGRPLKIGPGAGGGVTVEVPAAIRDPLDTVIALDLAPGA